MTGWSKPAPLGGPKPVLPKVALRPVGLISNADTIEVASWQSCPAAGVFDAELFSCHVGMAKPQPRFSRFSLPL